LGFAFKKDTNDTRESHAIKICRTLIQENAEIVVYNPRVSVQTIFDNIKNIHGDRLVEFKKIYRIK